MTESLALEATRLYSQGLTYDKIGKQLEVSKGRVGKLIRQGILVIDNHVGNPVEGSVVQVDAEQLNEADDGEPGLPIFDVPREYDYNGILEKTFLMKATPILRKVALNPRIFFYYNFAVKKFGWEGDIGDFLVECVEDFWKKKGYSIRVMYDEEMEW